MVKIIPAGDQAVTIEFSETIDDAVNARVIALDRAIGASPTPGITETVPTYRSLLVNYDPAVIKGRVLSELLHKHVTNLSNSPLPQGRYFNVPVCYHSLDALDLDELAAMKGISRDKVVALHSATTYRVYMIGFAPGFAYLGGLPKALHTPRLKEPRQKVAAGSIGIGNSQASINSLSGPSGWRYIGRTPLNLFNTAHTNPSFFKAGDLIRFFPITPDEIASLDRRVAAGEMIVEQETP